MRISLYHFKTIKVCMIQGNVYRIYPDDEQKTLIEKHIGCARFIYNRFLRIKKTFYDKFRINISPTELDKYLPT